jgi:hypothetical protein
MYRALMTCLLTCILSIPLDGEVMSAQPEEPSSEKDSFPFFFKVFSKDGRESLTALCNPTNSVAKPNEVNEIDCKFTNVRISNPNERVDKDEANIPTTVEELANKAPEYQGELKRNPRKAAESWNEYMEGLEKLRHDACSASSQQKWKSKFINSSAGPKRQKIFQGLIEACREKDPKLFVKQLGELERRSCDLWVDTFSLRFKKINIGHWLYQSDRPGLLSNVLKTYDLRQKVGHSTLATLTETRVPVSGASQKTPRGKPEQMVWSWDNYSEYEVSCDFITHKGVQASGFDR